ncbi:MAG: diguanylate cyclase domain-containing protein [Lachnospiraceae bacterium]
MIKKVISIIGAILIAISILVILINVESDYENWVSYVSTQINRSDGSIESYDSNIFKMVNKGDVITLTVKLPKEKKMDASVLYFRLYDSAINVYQNEKVIYSYGFEIAKSGQMIGAKYHFIPIPDDAWGGELIIDIYVNENKAYSKISTIRMYKATESYNAILQENIFSFFLAIVGIFTSAIIMMILLLFAKNNDITKQGVYIAAFVFSLSIWMLGNFGGYVIFQSSYMWAQIEFISLFVAPIFLLLYVKSTEKRVRYSKILNYFILSNVLYVSLVTILNFFTSIHFNVVLRSFHLLVVFDAIALIIIVTRRLKEKNATAKMFVIGIISFLIFAILDVIRHNIMRTFPSLYTYTGISVLPLGLLIFVICLIFSFYVENVNSYIDKSTKQKLISTAYIDFLTGIVSSAKCREKLEELDTLKKQEFIIVLIDLNNLKIVNDSMGHNFGDYLLKDFASIFNSYIGPYGIAGRLGGDEFIAIIEKVQKETILKEMEQFEMALERENNLGINPYKFTCAWGMAESTKEEPIAVKEAMVIADRMMYEDKKIKKST